MKDWISIAYAFADALGIADGLAVASIPRAAVADSYNSVDLPHET